MLKNIYENTKKKKIQHSTKLNAHLASNKTQAGKEQNTKNNQK